MIVINGKHCLCALCGAAFELPEGKLPVVSVDGESRVLLLDGVEVHRCGLPKFHVERPCDCGP